VGESGKLVVTVSQHTVFLAEAAIIECGSCSRSPAVPFSRVLDTVSTHSSGPADYILPVLGRCPSCQAQIHEETMVVPRPSRRR
jgi:hypothetical protein